MKDGILLKTTLVDFPSVLSAAFFLPGCNLRCPYCQNRELVLGLSSPTEEDNWCSLEELFAHLEKRKNILSGLVISGGEALMNSKCKEILYRAKEMGYKTKVDTNGTFPQKLQEILKDKELEPDFIALDVKTSPEKYLEKLLNFNNQAAADSLAHKILESIEILSSLPPERREFRTVLVPSIVDETDIERISNLLPPDAVWYMSHFSNASCLSPDFENIAPFSKDEEENFLKIARKKIKNTFLR